jgi:hypothetical protein
VIDPALLADATKAVMGDRHDQYGDPEENLGRIGQLWTAWLGTGRPISAHDVAVMMALVKISRARHREGGQHRDNFVDGIGYLALAERLGRPWT